MFNNSLITSALIILSNIIILFLICILGIKFKKIRILDTIYIRQYFFSMISTVIIGCLFSPIIATALYIIFFFLYRIVIFKDDAFEIQCIYSLYNGSIHLSPPIKNLSCVLRPYNCMEKKTGYLKKEYRYTFSQYSNSAIYIFILYCVKDMGALENPILYGFEFFIAMTLLYIFLAKWLYHLSLSTPNSLFFLCPKLSYIPVILFGLLFYGISILIFITTL